MPSAAELLFVFRVITRCIAIVSRQQQGLEAHLTRGLLCTEYDQYQLAQILTAAQSPLETAVGRCLNDLLNTLDLPPTPTVAVINLRNDGELNQAILLASLLKQRAPTTTVVLDTSGANEQFNFGEWVPLFTARARELSPFVDYFVPRQDYKASLRALIAALAAGVRPNVQDACNVIALDASRPTSGPALVVPSIDDAFDRYVRTLPVFHAAGQRTLVARLSPAKCHWSACSFCTINTQHLAPKGLAMFDASYQRHFDALVRKIREDRVESLILMDEALHPHVLLDFARALLASDVSVVYRARCRFTDDLTAEACRTLYASGCRYLGLGLEAASPRVNRLVNKHMGAPIDYEAVLTHLDEAGVRMHVYAIMGFPTETADEILATRDFLVDNIQRRRYLTVSANLFHLMRGSGIAREPSAFGITDVADTGDVALVLRFVERERERNESLVEASARQAYQAEFLPDIDDGISAEGFWHFIDQTGMFYVQKVVHPKNPYHQLAEARATPLPSDFGDWRFERSHLFWIEDPATDRTGLLCDWVTFNYVEVPAWLKDFIFECDPTLPLHANAERLLDDRDRRDAAVDAFRTLAAKGLVWRAAADAPFVEADGADDLAPVAPTLAIGS
jgi:hypothetical protein